MKNSQLASDGRVYEDVVLNVCRTPDEWNGECTACSPFEGFEFLRCSADASGYAAKNANAGPVSYAASVCGQSEQRSVGEAGESGPHRALLRSRLRFFCHGSGGRLVGGFGHPLDGPATSR